MSRLTRQGRGDRFRDRRPPFFRWDCGNTRNNHRRGDQTMSPFPSPQLPLTCILLPGPTATRVLLSCLLSTRAVHPLPRQPDLLLCRHPELYPVRRRKSTPRRTDFLRRGGYHPNRRPLLTRIRTRAPRTQPHEPSELMTGEDGSSVTTGPRSPGPESAHRSREAPRRPAVRHQQLPQFP